MRTQMSVYVVCGTWDFSVFRGLSNRLGYTVTLFFTNSMTPSRKQTAAYMSDFKLISVPFIPLFFGIWPHADAPLLSSGVAAKMVKREAEPTARHISYYTATAVRHATPVKKSGRKYSKRFGSEAKVNRTLYYAPEFGVYVRNGASA